MEAADDKLLWQQAIQKDQTHWAQLSEPDRDKNVIT